MHDRILGVPEGSWQLIFEFKNRMVIAGVREQHLRFGFSPARETLRGIEVLLQPGHHSEQMPWIRVARRKLRRGLKTELQYFRFLFVPAPELFPMLWDNPHARGIATELSALRRRPRAYLEAIVRRLSGKSLLNKAELGELLKPRWYRRAAPAYGSRDPYAHAFLADFVSSPASSLQRFCEMLGAMYAEIVEPAWSAIESDLTDDIAMRRRLLRMHGVAALLRTLSPQLPVRHGSSSSVEIELGKGPGEIRFTASSRLILSPSFFCWPHFQAYVVKQKRDLRCTITYPIPPLPSRIRQLPNRTALAATAAALGNDARLRIIELLRGRDLSTRELSGFLRLSAPLISRHLRVLLQAGLLERFRNGYFVMYRLKREALTETAKGIAAIA